MNQTIRERSEMDPAYMWDLSKMYESDAAWEAELCKAEPAYRDVMKLRGTIRDAATLKTALEKKRDLMRLLARLTGYAMLRKSEDNRGVGVSMYNRVSLLAAEAETAVSFLEPEILALPEEQLTAMADMESLKEWQFWLQDLISRKAHMLSGREEMILAAFAEAFDASGRAADALRDADLQFADALDQNGDPHQVSNLNFVILQNDPDRILRENVFR